MWQRAMTILNGMHPSWSHVDQLPSLIKDMLSHSRSSDVRRNGVVLSHPLEICDCVSDHLHAFSAIVSYF